MSTRSRAARPSQTYLERWLAAQPARLRPSTLDSYRRVLRAHVIPELGARPLARLSASQLDELYAQLLVGGRSDGKGGLSARTVRYVHTIVRRALADAVRKGVVPRNVADLAAAVRRSDQSADDADVDGNRAALLPRARAGRSPVRGVAGARETGARRGEVLGISWSDLDLDQRRMSIVHTIIEVLGVRWSDLDLDQRRMSIVHTIIDGDGAHRCRAPRAAVAATSRSTRAR